jgi:tetratricopeptide (TPR) repeat protein
MKPTLILLSSLLILTSYSAQAEETDPASDLKTCGQAVFNGDNAKALAIAEKLLKQDPANRTALLCRGRANTGLGQYGLALKDLQAAEKLSVAPLEHMKGLTFIANAQRDAKNYSEALSSYRQSLAIAQEQKDRQFERINLNQIGDILTASNQPEAALQSHLAAGKLDANDNERAESYGLIAAAYEVLGQHDKAIENQIKATVMEERAGELDNYANSYLELGRIYTAAKDYPRAEKAINKIIKLSKDQGGPYWEAKSYYYLARTKIAAGDSAAAKPLLNDALRISQQAGEQPLSEEIKLALAKLN